MKTRNGLMAYVFIIALFIASQPKSFAHCEVPCGIFADSVQITLIYEHITTIEKAMIQIDELSKADDKNYNQIVRWITNKEEHAEKIQEIVSQYFLHQRIKITDPANVEAYAKYTNQLSLLHQISVYSMKSKQSTDVANIAKLRKAVSAFEKTYFHTHD